LSENSQKSLFLNSNAYNLIIISLYFYIQPVFIVIELNIKDETRIENLHPFLQMRKQRNLRL